MADTPNHDPNGFRAYVSTIAVLGLAFQIRTVKAPSGFPDHVAVTTDLPIGPWDDVTMRLWPLVQSQSWPLRLGLDGFFGLNELANRWKQK
jgi:hypothetical protein